MHNDLDVYWLRAKVRQRLPELIGRGCYDLAGVNCKDSVEYGASLVLQCLCEVTGVDFSQCMENNS